MQALLHQRHEASYSSRQDEDDKDAGSPLCRLLLPLAHIKAGEIEKKIDKGNERAEQMESLTQQRSGADFQCGEPVSITGFGKDGKDAVVERVIRVQMFFGRFRAASSSDSGAVSASRSSAVRL